MELGGEIQDGARSNHFSKKEKKSGQKFQCDFVGYIKLNCPSEFCP